MTVYVDDMNLPATVQNGPRVSHTSEWSHLFADTEEELHAFAARLGLKRSYFQQGKPDWFPHDDVTKGKRYQALRLGAAPVSARDAAVIARERDARQAEPERAEYRQCFCGPDGQEHLHTIPPKRERAARQPQPRGRRAERDPGKPPELTAADRRRMADEYALDAGHAWKAGDVAKAARLVRVAADLDPSRPELWAGRQQQIQARASRMPLAVQTAARLGAAGVTPDDPVYQRLQEHNRLRREAQAEAAGPQPGSDPEAA